MKDTLYSYSARSDYDRDVTVKGNTFRCYSAKKMRELYPQGGYKTVGETVSGSGKAKSGKNGKNSQNSARAGQLAVGSLKYNVGSIGSHPSLLYAPCGYVRVGEDTFVVLLRSRLAVIPWVLIGIVFVGLLLLINFHDVWFGDVDPGIIDPSYEDTDTDPQQKEWDDPNDTATLTDYARVKIPIGTVEFLYDLSGQFADGPVRASLAIEVDGVGYVLTNKQTEIIGGKLPDTTLDWDLIHTELKAGTYVGSLLLVQTDPETGEETETFLAIPIEIKNAYGGTISIGYSTDAYVNLSSGKITMRYQHAKSATHNAILQLVIDSGDDAYVIATSGVITPGHELTEMTLDPAYERLLKANGVYEGRLRVNYYSDDNAAFNFNTDIVVEIHVRRE